MSGKEQTTEVEILGERYVLRASDSPDYLQRVAAYVDGKCLEVTKGGQLLAPSKVAVLASLNIADELFKHEEADRQAEARVLARIDGIVALLHRGGDAG
jgi:cell division protein ZapA